jgi:hypothetical protein
VTVQRGRLFTRTLLPEAAQVGTLCGEDAFLVDGRRVPPARTEAEQGLCRIEVRALGGAERDRFLHLLFPTSAQTVSLPPNGLSPDGLGIVIVGPDGTTTVARFAADGGLGARITIYDPSGAVVLDDPLGANPPGPLTERPPVSDGGQPAGDGPPRDGGPTADGSAGDGGESLSSPGGGCGCQALGSRR